MPDLPAISVPSGEAPVFDAPWQARLFALTLTLVERGVFAWTDWTPALARAIRSAEADAARTEPSGDPSALYWRAWSEALSALLAERGLATPAEVERGAGLWQQAAARTPHGQPIQLDRPD